MIHHFHDFSIPVEQFASALDGVSRRHALMNFELVAGLRYYLTPRGVSYNGAFTNSFSDS
jgi:hypothetical protein